METIRIEIVNPKAKKLLRDLAAMNLINIQKSVLTSFADLLKKLRTKAETSPTLDEITAEVEAVRARRYGK